MITTTDLVEEGIRMARPSLLLRAEGSGAPTAVWRCDAVTASGGAEHWITIDGAALASLGFAIDGCVDVFVGGEEVAVQVPGTLADRGLRGVPLYASEAPSFPPLNALCLHGGPVVEQWLRSLGASRRDGDNPRVFDSAAGDGYVRAWQERCPLYTGDADVVLGGWHMLWPDDDEYDRPGEELLLWTFRDAEPWVEVWRGKNGELRAIERIT